MSNENFQNMEKIVVPVEGMTCASCVARVEKSISKVVGVKNVSVNLATEKALIEFEKDKVNFQEIIKSVEDAGYKIGLDYQSNQFHDEKKDIKTKNVYSSHELQRDFMIAVLFTIPITFLSMSMMWIDFDNLISLNTESINKILLILTTPVVFISGKRFYKAFWSNLKHFSADMNTLVAVGTGSAYFYSMMVVLFPDLLLNQKQEPHVYFDTSAVIISLILMGKWLEARAKHKTSSAIKKLTELKPEFALVKTNGGEQKIPVENVKVGDIIIVKTGAKIPADGIIQIGNCLIDESMITGESIPSIKSVGSKVIGGTINKSGYFEFKVTAVGSSSLLGQIIKMIEEAQGSKAPIQNIADKVASVFVPVVIIIAVLTFIIWLIFDSPFNIALINFVAVLIIACPCALGLATPTALIVGIGKAAQMGILVKNGEGLEISNKITTLIFDKTGTLTEGFPQLTQIITRDISEEEVLALVASVEKKSEHPFANSIVKAAEQRKIKLVDAELLYEMPGRGIVGKVNNQKIIVGNITFLNELNIKFDSWVEKAEKEMNNSGTLIFVALHDNINALMKFDDKIKEESIAVIENLKSMKLKVGMLTGDNFQNAKAISEKLNLDFFDAEILPNQKANIVKKYQSQNEVVAMVGDGINDSPALVQSDVGIAMGSATDIAIENSSIVIMRNNLTAILSVIKLSKKVIKTIKQNLFWAFFYNVVCIPLAAIGFLNPMLAALAMSLSSVSVVTNSLRIKNFKEK